MPAFDRELRSPLVPLVLAYVRAAGGDASALAAGFDLPLGVASASLVSLPVATVRAVCEAASRLLAAPTLGLAVAAGGPRGAYGVVEYAARCAPTLYGAAERLLRFQQLVSGAGDFALERRGATVALEHRVRGMRDGLGRHGNEYTAAVLLRYCRDLTGTDLRPRRAWFSHASPSDPDALVVALGTTRIDFGRSSTGLLFDAADFDRPVATADPALLAILEAHAEALLPPGAAPVAAARAHVRARLRSALVRGEETDAEALAAALRMSPRTLRRRLANEGTSYHVVLDEVRRDLAHELVAERGLGATEVAFVLGYSDLRAFLRAFKRWTGTTPTRYRRAPAAP